jgi:hypothetical protein
VTREEFEHVIRAAATIVDDELVVVGSQAILARFPDAPAELRTSDELDLYPRSDPDRATDIDRLIGAGSLFEETFGYRAHGVAPETSALPESWEQRVVRVTVDRPDGGIAVAYAPDPHDLVIAKLSAGRQKDYDFAVGALRAGLIDADELERRCDAVGVHLRDVVRQRVAGVKVRAGR